MAPKQPTSQPTNQPSPIDRISSMLDEADYPERDRNEILTFLEAFSEIQAKAIVVELEYSKTIRDLIEAIDALTSTISNS